MSDSRQYPARPIVGVGALIFDERGRVLMIQRGKEPLTGYWALPGGAVEAGERLEDAMRREVQEETGLDVSVDSIATVFERIMPDAAGRCEYHYVLVDFFCTIRAGELRAGDDSAAAAWFEISELGNVQLTEGTKSVVEECCRVRSAIPYVTRP